MSWSCVWCAILWAVGVPDWPCRWRLRRGSCLGGTLHSWGRLKKQTYKIWTHGFRWKILIPSSFFYIFLTFGILQNSCIGFFFWADKTCSSLDYRGSLRLLASSCPSTPSPFRWTHTFHQTFSIWSAHWFSLHINMSSLNLYEHTLQGDWNGAGAHTNYR